MAFAKKISQFEGKKGQRLDTLFNDLLELATDRNNNDGTIAPPLTTDEEDEIINMMII